MVCNHSETARKGLFMDFEVCMHISVDSEVEYEIFDGYFSAFGGGDKKIW